MTMPEFAFIFRVTRDVTPDEAPRRAAAVREWAISLRTSGTIGASFLFDDAGFQVASDRGAAPITRDGAVGGVTIVRAASLDAALGIAKTFPGLAFGGLVEVRPVKPLPSPPGPR